MTRTTLDLDSSVLEQLRRRARTERKSMGQLASERLAAALGDETTLEPAPLAWPSRHMGKPKVDLADKDALWRALDERQPDEAALGGEQAVLGGEQPALGGEQPAGASRAP